MRKSLIVSGIALATLGFACGDASTPGASKKVSTTTTVQVPATTPTTTGGQTPPTAPTSSVPTSVAPTTSVPGTGGTTATTTGGNSRPRIVIDDPHATPAPPAPVNSPKAIEPNQTLEAGTIVVVREVDHGAKTVNVYAAKLGAKTTIGKAGLQAVDGWYGYNSLVFAQQEACRQAVADSTAPWAGGYDVTLNGGDVPKSCS